MQRLAVICLLGLAAATLWLRPAGAATMAERYAGARASFENAIKKADADHANERRALPARYIKALTTLQKRSQAAGDLEAWSVIAKELERYRTEAVLREEHVVTANADLANVQRQFAKLQGAYDKQHHEAVLALRNRYVEQLEAQQVALTRAGRIEDAKLAQEEIQHVTTMDAITAAEFALAAARETAAEPDSTSTDTGSDNGADDTSTSHEQPPEPVTTPSRPVPEGVIFHEPGSFPPRKKDYVYKRQSLTRTDNSPLRTPVSVGLAVSDQSKRSFASSRYSYYGSRSASPKALALRLTVRASGTVNAGIEGLTLQLIHYVSPVTSSTRDPKPRLGASIRIPLPPLDTQQRFIDLPMYVTSYYDLDGREGYDYHYRSSSLNYDGCCVSVLDEKGELVYQGVSDHLLKPFAPAVIKDSHY